MTIHKSGVLGLLFIIAVPAVCAQTVRRSTTTTLSMTFSSTVSPTGAVVILTARVVASDQSAISHGRIKFCDADAPRCDGLSMLGMAQLDANGVAISRLELGPGQHRVRAVFCGTPHSDPPAAGSTSGVQIITIKTISDNTLDGGLL